MIKHILFSAFVFLFVTACVPPRQFSALEHKYDTCIIEREYLKAGNESLTVENTELNAKLKECKESIAVLGKDSLHRSEELVKARIEYNNLLDRYNRLKESQDALISGSEQETRKLLAELQKTQEGLVLREDKLRETENALEAKKRSVEQLQREMEAQQKRLVDLEKIMNAKDSVMRELKNKISAALLGFEGQGITVTRKNGRVYVSMDEKLLFSSGSFEIGSQGIDALKKLAKVLEQNPDIYITIEGHTDDVPYISDAVIKDNWDLSVKRATTVVRLLTANSKIDPKRLTAAGRGEFLPVDPAKTKEARSKNRRTEIILTPRLDELYELLKD